MNTYSYNIKLTVSVEAFDDSDAWEALQDVFAVGEQGGGVSVEECEYKENKRRRD